MTRTPLRRAALGLVAAPLLLLAAACGSNDANSFDPSSGSIPQDKVEGQLMAGMTDQYPSGGFSGISCEGDIKDEVNAMENCMVTYNGKTYTVPAEITESTDTQTTITFDYSALPAAK